MIDPNELERLSKAAVKTEDDIRYYSGGSKYNEPLEQLKDQLVHLYRAGQLVPVQQPSGDVVEAVARAIMVVNGACLVKDWAIERRDNPHVALAWDQATAAITALDAVRVKQ